MITDSGISKVYVDEHLRGQGENLEKKFTPLASAKQFGRGVLPTTQQKQLAAVSTMTAGGAYGGKKYGESKRAGAPALPPAVRRASKVVKAQRRVNPEYDRARRRGVLQGAAVGGAIPLAAVGARTFKVTPASASGEASGPRTWRGKGVGVRSSPSGKFPRGRAAALAGAGLLAGGAALAQRRGTKERNRAWE